MAKKPQNINMVINGKISDLYGFEKCHTKFVINFMNKSAL